MGWWGLLWAYKYIVSFGYFSGFFRVRITAIEVLYVRKVGDYTKVAGEAWESIMSFAYPQKIKFKKNLMGKDAQMFGIGHDNPSITPKNELRYDACISYDGELPLAKELEAS